MVVAIAGTMSAIILANLPMLQSKTSIDLVAQEVAIYVRGAQVYSGASRLANGAITSYGASFSSSNQASFSLYPFDCSSSLCNSGPSAVENYTLPNGFLISLLEYHLSSTPPTYNPASLFSIVFKRPDPEAKFQCGANVCSSAYPVDRARLTISSKRNPGEKRYVMIYPSGQIAVTRNAN